MVFISVHGNQCQQANVDEDESGGSKFKVTRGYTFYVGLHVAWL